MSDDDEVAEVIAEATLAPGASRASRRRRANATTNRWMRTMHVWTSMISLLLVLFFGITGLTLNHPDWTLGFAPTERTSTGTLPDGAIAADGTPDFLAISEFARTKLSVVGDVGEYGVADGQGDISYKGPGYAADISFKVADRSYALVVDQQGLVGVLNDLHKGRDTASGWKWVIDASAIVLVLVSLTGLGIQLFQRKRRRLAVGLIALGLIAGVWAMIATMV